MQLKRMAGMAVAGVLALSVSGCQQLLLAAGCGDRPVHGDREFYTFLDGTNVIGFSQERFDSAVADYEACVSRARAGTLVAGTALAVIGTIIAVGLADDPKDRPSRPQQIH